ncbi:hypothetical protein V5O48_003885 [Marasmius crinis-equi]|uniref:DUF6589 domain-containing protein n=1 Tax=Marasmius crinis-equi TaxID=585013 RepID=A0ABR3FSD6_9AGAR
MSRDPEKRRKPNAKSRRNWKAPLDPTPAIPPIPSSPSLNVNDYRTQSLEAFESSLAGLRADPQRLWDFDGEDIEMRDLRAVPDEMEVIGGSFPPGTPNQTQKHPFQLPTPSSPSNGHTNSQRSMSESLGSPINLRQSSAPFSTLSSAIPPHPQRLTHPKKSKLEREHEKLAQDYQKVDGILHTISESGFSIGTFMSLLFASSKNDLRTPLHKKLVARFLQGQDQAKFVDILKRVYNHRSAYPSYRSRHKSERQHSFSVSVDPTKLRFARIISSFSARLCAEHAHRDVGVLTQEEKVVVEGAAKPQMPMSEVTWQDIEEFSPKKSVDTFRRRAPFISGFLEFIIQKSLQVQESPQDYEQEETDDAENTSPTEKKKKNRPTDIIILASMNPLIVSRNKRATGYLSMPLGVHQFSTQTHTDIKRITSRMGLSVSDTTTRKALDTMTKRDLEAWREMNADAAAKGELGSIEIIDNTQRQHEAWEAGLFRQNELISGTSCTSVKNLQDHLNRVAQNKCLKLTTSSLFMSIDWKHHLEVSALHCTHALLNFIPSLLKLHSKTLMDHFRSPPVALHRIPDNVRTVVQPLGTNAEKEVETQGLKRCIIDFDQQSGLTAADDERVLEWLGGDGATFATFQRLQKDTLRNKISTPEAWHAKHTALIAIAQNHFGPAACMDPSSLSKLYGSISFKRPADPKKCDHYPTVGGMTIIWIGQILDCFRIMYDTDDLESYFASLEASNTLPSFDDILSKARLLAQRYASARAYEHALSSELHRKASPALKVPAGSPWTSPDVFIAFTPTEFDGDRTLANSILFKMQFGSWLALDFAIHDGEVGRVMEQLKVWIFMFAGSSHQQYSHYLLELHCLLEFESSPALRTAIMNNYLVKFGLRAKEHDLMQEDHNKKLEEMVTKAGSNFDDPHYRHIISPNVRHFVELRGAFETAFQVYHRSNKHTSPHMAPELHVLLKDIKLYELNYFRQNRFYGHIAIDLQGAGYRALEQGGKLDAYVTKSSARSDFIIEIEKEKSKVKHGVYSSSTENYTCEDVVMGEDNNSNTSNSKDSNESESDDSETTSNGDGSL